MTLSAQNGVVKNIKKDGHIIRIPVNVLKVEVKNGEHPCPKSMRSAFRTVEKFLSDTSCAFLKIKNGRKKSAETLGKVFAVVAQRYRHVYLFDNEKGEHAGYDLITGNSSSFKRLGGKPHISRWGLIKIGKKYTVQIS